MKKLLTLCFLLVGCGASSSTITGTTPDTGTTGGGSSTSDISRVVSVGENLSFNNMTGGPQDIAINPTTGLPAVAYYDKSASAGGTGATPTVGALKYAYMDSTGNWNIEVVDQNFGTATCGTINSVCVGAPNGTTATQLNHSKIIAIAHKSNGTPVIAYVYGSSVGTTLIGTGTKDIRVAERSTAGVWTISVPFSASVAAGATNVAIATYDGLKAVTLFLDSADRPHITFAFYTQTSTNSQIKYLFRDSSNNWSSANIMPAVTLAGTITAFQQGTMTPGAAFCGVNGAPLYTYTVPSAAAGGLQNPYLIRCTTLAASGACTAWETLNLARGCTGSAACTNTFTAATTNAGTHTSIGVEPTTNRPVLAIYSTAIPNVSTITVRAPNACNASQGGAANSWGAAATVAAASTGIGGLKLIVKGVTDYLLAATVSTTAVAVSKFSGAAWFAAVQTVETTTVAQDGIGAAYDSTSDMLYASYAQLPAAAGGAIGNDLKVAAIDPDDLTTGGAAGSFATWVVDNRTNTFPNVATVPLLSAAKSSSGLYGYAYYFFDNNATHANSKLYYGIRGGTAASPVFSEKFVTSFQQSAGVATGIGLMPSLAYDSGNNPIIAAFNGAAAESNLVVARSPDGGASFSVNVVDDTSASVGQYASVAVTGSTIGVAYYDTTNTALKFARWTAAGGWRRFVVDGNAGTGSCGNTANDAGKYAKLQWTSAGRPVIAYQYDTGVRIAVATEATSSNTYTWTCGAVESSASTLGTGISFKLDSSDLPYLVYNDTTAGSIRYAYCSSAAATCAAAGSSAFTTALVELIGVTSSVGETAPSLAISSSGTKYVSFHNFTSKALRLGTMSSSASTFTLESIDYPPSGSNYTTPVGQYAATLINDSAGPMVFYRSNENWLKYFSRE